MTISGAIKAVATEYWSYHSSVLSLRKQPREIKKFKVVRIILKIFAMSKLFVVILAVLGVSMLVSLLNHLNFV